MSTTAVAPSTTEFGCDVSVAEGLGDDRNECSFGNLGGLVWLAPQLPELFEVSLTRVLSDNEARHGGY